MRAWIDADNVKRKPPPPPVVRLSYENSGDGEYYTHTFTNNSTTSSAPTKPVVPSQRPVKSVEVVRRMIRHDLGIKLPKKTPEERDKEPALGEQATKERAAKKERAAAQEKECVMKGLMDAKEEAAREMAAQKEKERVAGEKAASKEKLDQTTATFQERLAKDALEREERIAAEKAAAKEMLDRATAAFREMLARDALERKKREIRELDEWVWANTVW